MDGNPWEAAVQRIIMNRKRNRSSGRRNLRHSQRSLEFETAKTLSRSRDNVPTGHLRVVSRKANGGAVDAACYDFSEQMKRLTVAAVEHSRHVYKSVHVL